AAVNRYRRPARLGWSARRPWEPALWHADRNRQFVSSGNVLRAEAPEPGITFHFWLSSRSGQCGRATRSFCRCATSISSYRALLALSSEPAELLPIRHCVLRALLSPFPHLRLSLQHFQRLKCGRAEARPSHRPRPDRAGAGAATPSPRSLRGDPPPELPANGPRAQGAYPSDSPPAPQAPGNRGASRAAREFSRAPGLAAAAPWPPPDFPGFFCASPRA